MTYVRPDYIRDTHILAHEPPHWFKLALIRMIVAFYCQLRGVSTDDFYDFIREELSSDLQAKRVNHRTPAPSRNLAAIKPMIPRDLGADLSPNQILERCTRLSAMSRSHAYQLHDYRWDFWRKGAVRQRAKAPNTTTALTMRLDACGLSAAHAWPD